jgi:UPF0176 protein
VYSQGGVAAYHRIKPSIFRTPLVTPLVVSYICASLFPLNVSTTDPKPYHVLLYYYFAPVADPQILRNTEHQFCLQHNLLGRIIVASEGINGTISGLKEDCKAYMEYLQADPRFAKIQFKIDDHDRHAFQKLHVRVKEEIVNAGLPHILPYESTGKRIAPKELAALLADKHQIQGKDYYIVDVRSDYEYKMGRFKGCHTLPISNFRELTSQLKKMAHLKDKKVITVCTGNIKCEKASAYLISQGFDNTYQLDGGIIKYGKETNGQGFEGRCYVFDNRISVAINRATPTIISACHSCEKSCERMINCANASCNSHLAMCVPCSEKLKGCCSTACEDSPAKRSYDGSGYYTKASNGYNAQQAYQAQHKAQLQN